MKIIKKALIVIALIWLFSTPCVFAVDGFSSQAQSYFPIPALRRMESILTANSNLTIDSSGEAKVISNVVGYKGITTKITVTVSLQQFTNGRWKTVQNYRKKVDTYKLTLSTTRKLSKGYAYRLLTKINAFKGSSVEVRTVTSAIKRY